MIIKILLIVSVLGLFILLLRSQGSDRSSAVAKIGICILLLFAGYAVLRPDDVTWVAERIGVGRGTDLLLYAFVVGFGFFAVVIYLRFRELEQKYTKLARAMALLEAERTGVKGGLAGGGLGGRADEIVHSRHPDPISSTFGRAGEDDPREPGGAVAGRAG